MSVQRLPGNAPARPIAEPRPTATPAPESRSSPAPKRDDAFTRAGSAPTHANPCPMLGALQHGGALTPDAEGEVTLAQLDQAFQKELGMSVPTRVMFQLMAPTSLSPRKLLGNLIERKVDLEHLRGDFFDHRWDSGLLRGGQFNEGAFRQLAAHSADGETLTIEEWMGAMRTELDRARAAGEDVPTGKLGTAYEAGFVTFEASLLFAVLGARDGQGTARVALDDVLTFYRDKEMPEGFQPGRANANMKTLASGMTRAMFGLVTGNKGAGAALEGERLALGRDKPVTEAALTGTMKGVCPAGGSAANVRPEAMVDPSSALKNHEAQGGRSWQLFAGGR